MKTIDRGIASFLISCLLFSGCARFAPTPMPSIQPQDYPHYLSKDGIEVRVYSYSREDIRKYFASDLAKKNIWPLRLYIKNNSSKTYLFTKGLVEPNQISSHEAARKGRRKAGWRLTWGLLFYITIFGIPIAIPLFVTGCQALGANSYMTRGYHEWEIADMRLESGKAVSGIIFFQNPSLPQEFQVTLLEDDSDQKLVIPINLKDVLPAHLIEYDLNKPRELMLAPG